MGFTAKHLLQGRKAENLANDYLRQRGLKLVTRNYRTPYGEIDLVMQQGQMIVFVEVRYRKSTKFGHPAETINWQKQKRLRASAEYYFQKNKNLSNCPCRFDIIAISQKIDEGHLQWLKDSI